MGGRVPRDFDDLHCCVAECGLSHLVVPLALDQLAAVPPDIFYKHTQFEEYIPSADDPKPEAEPAPPRMSEEERLRQVEAYVLVASIVVNVVHQKMSFHYLLSLFCYC